MQDHFGDVVLLCDGPPLREDSGGGGFFYEMCMADDTRITDSHFDAIMHAAKAVVKSRQRFYRLEVDRATARQFFSGNRFKLGLIDSIPDGDVISLYRCGNFIDLCRGPHVPHTGVIKVRVVRRPCALSCNTVCGVERCVGVLSDVTVRVELYCSVC
jgi:threonyl-tRNA synthetase